MLAVTPLPPLGNHSPQVFVHTYEASSPQSHSQNKSGESPRESASTRSARSPNTRTPVRHDLFDLTKAELSAQPSGNPRGRLGLSLGQVADDMQRRIYAIHGETNGNVEIRIQAGRIPPRATAVSPRYSPCNTLSNATQARNNPPTPGIRAFHNLVGGLCHALEVRLISDANVSVRSTYRPSWMYLPPSPWLIVPSVMPME